jgi:hypothetical protein
VIRAASQQHEETSQVQLKVGPRDTV